MEDQEKHPFRSAIRSSLLFSAGYALKDSVYLRRFNLNKKSGAVLGAAFALLPALFGNDDDKTSTVATIGFMAGSAMYGHSFKVGAANNFELFENTFKTMKKVNERQKDIKKWFIEARQRVVREKEFEKGYVKGVLGLGKELADVTLGKGEIKRSKAFFEYEKEADRFGDMTLEELRSLGKKIPFQHYDYFYARRNFEHQVGGSNLESGFLTATGYFSKIEDGKLKLDIGKFFTENANYVSDKIEFLDSVAKMHTKSKEDFDSFVEMNKEGFGFFQEALKEGKHIKTNQLRYRDIIEAHSEEIKKTLGSQAHKYFNKDGSAKYLDILGDQKFSDNIIWNTKKGRMLDATWFNAKNYGLDLMKGADSSFRAFFKNSPLNGGINQFPLMEFFGVDTKLHKSIHGDKMKNFYIVRQDNIDMNKTLHNLNKQINFYRKVGKQEWRERNGYKTISQALYTLNKRGENIYSTSIKDKEDLSKVIRLLEYKKSYVKDTLEKTGGILKKSPMYGLSSKMDKTYKKYYVEKASNGEFALFEKTEDKITAAFAGNKAYIKEGKNFSVLEGSYHLDYSKGTKVLQAKKDGDYFTTSAKRKGQYIERDNVAMPFHSEDFKNIYRVKGTKEAVQYLKQSDINFIPGFGKTAFNKNSNFIEENLETIKNLKAYLNINKTNGDKNNPAELLALLTGFEKQTKQFQEHLKVEINNSFDIFLKKHNKGLEELSIQVDNNLFMKNKLKKFTGKQKINNISTHLNSMSSNEIEELFTNKIQRTEDVDNFLKIKKSFERTVDRHGLVNQYKSINNIKVADQMLKDNKGLLFSSSNIKEDIIINTFNQMKNYEEFENTYGNFMSENILFQKENLFNKNRILNVNTNSPAIVKYWGSENDFSNKEHVEKLFNDTSKMSNNISLFFTKGLESFENSLEVLGMPKLSPYNQGSSARYSGNLLGKRILPAYALYAGYQMANSFVDMVLPDSVPIFGQGLTAGAFEAMAATRMATQVLINGIGMGAVFRKMEQMFPGMLTDNGLLSPLQLSATNQEMYDELYNGKEITVKKNRFWFSSGRQKFEGGETEEIRPHLLYIGRHRTSGIYRNKTERFFRQDFFPTKLLWTLVDPYMEERINQKTRPVAKSMDFFDDVPLVGGFMNATLGQLIKPTKYFNKDEWYIEDGVMLNPNYDGQKNTLKYMQYDNSNGLVRASYKAYDELKNMMGMRGFLLGQAATNIFGTDNPYKEKPQLQTLSNGNSIQDEFGQLKLGGMFGLTEPIRRLLPENTNDEYVSPLRNNSLPDWMPENYFKDISHGNIYSDFSFGEFVLPGETYKKYNRLHPDDTGEYGVVDKLKILSIVAPYSKEYRHARATALERLDSMDEDSRQIVYQALSYATKHKQRDVDEDTQFKTQVTTTDVTVKHQIRPLEFIGEDNKRYKLAGLTDDFLNGVKNDIEMTKELDLLRTYLKSRTALKGIIDANKISSVKTDNDGQYIEIYVPQFDILKELKTNNYLRYSENSNYGIPGKLLHMIKNSKKPFYLEKVFGSKDILHRYYYENILDPAFKDWNSPIESFVTPLVDTAANGGLSGYIGSMNISMRMGDFGDPIMPGLTTLAFIKGKLFGKNNIDREDRQDRIKNMIEYAKHEYKDETFRGNFNSSIYDMKYSDGLSKVKNYLTATERKYIDDIANAVDPNARKEIYNNSNTRMKLVLGHLWQQQSNYVGGNYKAEKLEMPQFNQTEIPDYFGTNDGSYNDAIFKKNAGFDLTKYEERMLNLYGDEQLKEWKSNKNLSAYVDRMMANRANYKQRVLSTIMPSNMLIFDKNEEYDSI